jgi:hypothetical protein
MRKYTGPALFAIVLGALVMAASPAWAQERAADGDPIRFSDTFTCPEGSSPVPDDASDTGFTCVQDPEDPETGTPVTIPTSTNPPIGDDDSEPPRPTGNTYDDTVSCDVSDQDQQSSGTTLCDRTTARVNFLEADVSGNHCVVAGSSFGSLIHTAVGRAGGWGGLRTKRSGCSA